jgi:hypothetical protein
MNGFVKSGTDRVLIILVEFAGTNQFTWTPGSSTWDPLGRCDNSEFDGTHTENAAASQFFAGKYKGGPISLSSLANQDILIRFRYTTDASIQGDGPFMDDLFVRAGTEVLLADDAEQERNLWTYTAPWARNDGFSTTGHNYYLQRLGRGGDLEQPLRRPGR